MKDPKPIKAIVGGAVAVTALAAIILFDQNSANRKGEAKVTTPVTRSVVSAPTATAPEPAFAIRELGVQTSGSVALWVWPAPKKGFRSNVWLSANAYLPDEVWNKPSWRATFCRDGRIPVKIWALRSGAVGWQRAYTTRTADGSHVLVNVSLPCERLGYVQVPLEPFRLGPSEQVGVEYSPAIIATDGVLPFASEVDNVSNAPVTVPAILVRVDVAKEAK